MLGGHFVVIVDALLCMIVLQVPPRRFAKRFGGQGGTQVGGAESACAAAPVEMCGSSYIVHWFCWPSSIIQHDVSVCVYV